MGSMVWYDSAFVVFSLLGLLGLVGLRLWWLFACIVGLRLVVGFIGITVVCVFIRAC